MTGLALYRAGSVADAIAAAGRPGALVLAGGTEVVAWLEHGVARPSSLVDISALPLAGVRRGADGVVIGALTRLADLARDPVIGAEVPALVAAIGQAASPAIRSMGTLAGNLLQRTRCPYFRSTGPCNQRAPGTGCSARPGDHRATALFGLSDRCVAPHPSDLTVVLSVIGAGVRLEGPAGERVIPVDDLYPATTAEETHVRLAPGELVTAVVIPPAGLGRTVGYRKARDRAGFDFALVTAAATCRLDGGTIVEAGLTLGSVGPGPRRCRVAEGALAGAPYTIAAIDEGISRELAAATPLPGAGFKVELARRVAVAALMAAGGEP